MRDRRASWSSASLRELIEESPAGLPLEIALPIALDLLRGLGYAHGVRSGDAVGVVHRDVKPRNVMVTFAGVTKLIDFGISRWLGDDGAWDATSVSGTRGYMAPEQQRGQRVDGRADIYAVGVTLREMLTGAPPIDDTGNAGATPGEIPEPYLRTIVERACAELPDERFADCADMLAALEGFATAANIAVSVTQVERWTSARFADRKAFLEHDAEHRRPKPPTNPTIVDGQRARGSQPAKLGSRLVFAAHMSNGEAWVAPVIERMIRREVLRIEDRRFHVAPRSDPTAQRIDIVCHVVEGGFQLDATHDGAVICMATGSSIVDAARAIVQAVTAAAPPQPSLAADPDEEREMRRLGAVAPSAYRRYRNAVTVLLSNAFGNSHALASSVERAIDDDPEWPRAYALLVVLYGIKTPDAVSTVATARARLSGNRDRDGVRLLDALDLIRREDHAAAFALLAELFHTDPLDPLIGSQLLREAVVAQELDDATAVARRCHREHPDLCFGFDLADSFNRTGREREAERVIRESAATRPENVTLVVELVRIEAMAMNLSEASRHTANLLAIHGEPPDLLTELYEATIVSGQLSHARRLAEQMLLGSPLERARGRYRMAVIAVLEGKFSAAHNSLRKAIEANRAFALESELTQCLELGRAVARVVNDLETQRRLTAELGDSYASIIGDPACAAIVRYELATLDGPASIDDHVASLDGASRDLARTRMLRTAALADPSLARLVVDAGFAGNEDNTASLLALGICARREGELAIARRSFEIARRLFSSTLSNQASPYHAVLAQFHLASTLAELGDAAGARAHYEAFVRCWGDADRPISEVALARKALAAR